MAENVDRLSNLPDELLSNILSLVPTKYAIKTSVLSTRWRYIWRRVHNLDFDDFHPVYGGYHFGEFVDQVLVRCETENVKTFRLRFTDFYIPESLVSKWIGEAVRLNVCNLYVQFRHIELPLTFFLNRTLTTIRLEFSQLHCPFVDPQASISLPCVKTLDIVVSIQLNENMFKIIHGCPVLESLSLGIKRRCVYIDNYRLRLPTLKRLKLSTCGSNPFINKAYLDVPNLEHLFVDGFLCSEFVREDLSSLVEAKVSCHVKWVRLWSKLLKGISKAKSVSLTIKFWDTFEDLFDLPKFPNLKHLELEGYVGGGCQLIPQILKRCSELEHLSIEKPKGGCWNEPDYVPTCMLKNLKTMKYTGKLGYDLGMKLLKFMLGNSKVLKMLTIRLDTMFSEREEKDLRAELLKFPWASRDCQLCFIRNGT